MVDNPIEPSPILVAHRGYSGSYPENTLRAYQEAYSQGARYMELDLQLTSDHVPVLHHDTNLARMANVELDVRDIALEDFLEYPAPYSTKFGETFDDNKFTSFKDYCSWSNQCGDVTTFVEIKQESIDRFGVALFFEKTLDDIRCFGLETKSIIISFNYEVLVHARRNSSLKIGWVLPDWSDENHDLANELQPDFLFSDTESLPRSNNQVWRGSWQWAIYNLDTVSSALETAKRGFGFLETNEIGSLVGTKGLRTQ